jgi:hypothetical protein
MSPALALAAVLPPVPRAARAAHHPARVWVRRLLALATFLVTLVGAVDADAQEVAEHGFVNVGLGPTVDLRAGQAQLHTVIQAGLLLGRHVSLLFEPSFAFGHDDTFITLPLALEYDVPVRTVPGLFIYPRGGMGGAIEAPPIGDARGYVAFLAEFGIKYVLHKQFTFGVEPFGFLGYVSSNPAAAYRFTFLFGLAL